MFTELGMREPGVIGGRDMIVPDRQRALEGGQCLPPLAELAAGQAKLMGKVGRAWIEINGASQFRGPGAECAACQQGLADQVARLRVTGIAGTGVSGH